MSCKFKRLAHLHFKSLCFCYANSRRNNLFRTNFRNLTEASGNLKPYMPPTRLPITRLQIVKLFFAFLFFFSLRRDSNNFFPFRHKIVLKYLPSDFGRQLFNFLACFQERTKSYCYLLFFYQPKVHVSFKFKLRGFRVRREMLASLRMKMTNDTRFFAN